MSRTFRALRVIEEDGVFRRRIQELSLGDLPQGDLVVRVKYSALNYKDALSATGHKGITRQFPHTPGIEAAGIVVESAVERFQAGDEVVVHGRDFGMNTSGGYSEFIRVPAEWALRLPEGLSLRESMILGAAGFTAAICLDKIQSAGPGPEGGEVLVTGATGGVGSMAVALFSQAGYTVEAATGKSDKADYLRKLGASSVISRDELLGFAHRPVLRERWAGAVDTVGGEILTAVIKSLKYGCSVTACGLALSHELNMTVYPFILRGVSLLGVDSAKCPAEYGKQIWNKLAGQSKPAILEEVCTECSLEQLEGYIQDILQGKVTGRIVIKIGD